MMEQLHLDEGSTRSSNPFARIQRTSNEPTASRFLSREEANDFERYSAGELWLE